MNFRSFSSNDTANQLQRKTQMYTHPQQTGQSMFILSNPISTWPRTGLKYTCIRVLLGGEGGGGGPLVLGFPPEV